MSVTINSYICKKIGEIEESTIDVDSSFVLSNREFNKKLFEDPFTTKKNKLLILCILSKLVYEYESLDVIDELTKEWRIKYEIIVTPNLVYGIFYTGEFIVVSFKGTSTYSDILNDINFVQIEDDYDIPGKIHRGFNKIVSDDKMIEKIESKVNKIASDLFIKHVYITGHSLGGALASVFHAYLTLSSLSVEDYLHTQVLSQLVTFGCPRVGNKQFSKNITNSLRVVNGNDIVTKIPVFCYNHCKELNSIGSYFSFRLLSDHHISKYYKNLISDKNIDSETITLTGIKN